jgi:DNA-binding PadR family transcriptional regulator
MGKNVLGEFEHQVLLAILRLGSESYSVPIVLELEERTRREVAPAKVYIALRRLEEKGLVSSRMTEGEDGSRTRRYFAITSEGMDRLRESRQTLVRLWEGVAPVLDES